MRHRSRCRTQGSQETRTLHTRAILTSSWPRVACWRCAMGWCRASCHAWRCQVPRARRAMCLTCSRARRYTHLTCGLSHILTTYLPFVSDVLWAPHEWWCVPCVVEREANAREGGQGARHAPAVHNETFRLRNGPSSPTPAQTKAEPFLPGPTGPTPAVSSAFRAPFKLPEFRAERTYRIYQQGMRIGAGRVRDRKKLFGNADPPAGPVRGS